MKIKSKSKVYIGVDWDTPSFKTMAGDLDINDLLKLNLNKWLKRFWVKRSEFKLTEKQDKELNKLIARAGKNASKSLSKIQKDVDKILSTLAQTIKDNNY